MTGFSLLILILHSCLELLVSFDSVFIMDSFCIHFKLLEHTHNRYFEVLVLCLNILHFSVANVVGLLCLGEDILPLELMTGFGVVSYFVCFLH